MQTTRPIVLVLSASAAGVLGCLYGIFQVTHGHQLPVASINSQLTMPLIAIILAALAYPIYKYRKAMLAFGKAAGKAAGLQSNKQISDTPNKELAAAAAAAGRAAGVSRPNPVNPFYALRVLVLAKATSVASAVMVGWHFGLIALQLSTPVIAPNISNNILAMIGAALALAVALAVERICKLPGESTNSSKANAEANPT